MRLPFFGKHEGNFSRKDDKTELFFKTSCRLTGNKLSRGALFFF